MPEIHQFRESLELSHQFSDAPWWMEVYRAASYSRKWVMD